MDVDGKKVLVVGLGVSGLWTVRWARSRGAAVTVSEMRPVEAVDPAIRSELAELGVRLEAGGHEERSFQEADLVVVSPGVPLDLGPVEIARAQGVPVMGEMELASRFVQAPLIAVTGSNGKSTVTTLLGHLLTTAGMRVFVGGNIGTPLMALVAEPRPVDVVVAEVSSFQLDSTETFAPHVSVLLNISPDHLDRYPALEDYVLSKYKVFRNQGREDFLILNDDDERLKGLVPATQATVLRYGLQRREGRQSYLEGASVVVREMGSGVTRYPASSFPLPGPHNLGNLMAALLAARAVGAAPEKVASAIPTFRGLPHRMERVADIGGVLFYDDSKATNVDAAVKAVQGLDRPLVLIAGGRHKGADYEELTRAAQGRVKGAVLLGEARRIMAASFQGRVPYRMAEDLPQAVAMAYGWACPGEAVLLAPACASFDMFDSYAHRGRVFREAISRLQGDAEKGSARGV